MDADLAPDTVRLAELYQPEGQDRIVEAMTVVLGHLMRRILIDI